MDTTWPTCEKPQVEHFAGRQDFLPPASEEGRKEGERLSAGCCVVKRQPDRSSEAHALTTSDVAMPARAHKHTHECEQRAAPPAEYTWSRCSPHRPGGLTKGQHPSRHDGSTAHHHHHHLHYTSSQMSLLQQPCIAIHGGPDILQGLQGIDASHPSIP